VGFVQTVRSRLDSAYVPGETALPFYRPAGPPVLVPHDPAWATRAQQHLSMIRDALTVLLNNPDTGVYEHIGSTAVQGLAAKGVVDLQVRLPALPEPSELDAALASAGWIPATGSRPDSPGVYRDLPAPGDEYSQWVWAKRLFTTVDPAPPAILHVRLLASPFGLRTVAFRDRLRADPDLRRSYEQLKLDLAATHADAQDYDDYTRAKTSFIQAASAD